MIVVEDTDEMFMRNRNRSSKTWQKLEKINKSEILQFGISDISDPLLFRGGGGRKGGGF